MALDEPLAPVGPPPIDAEARRPVENDLIAALARDRASRPPGARRGRPPGSKNKPKMDPATGQVAGLGRTAATPSPAVKTAAQLAAEAKAKKQRIDEMSAKILVEANEGIMKLLMQFGMPSGVLYAPGQAPTIKPVDSKYTPIANQIAVKPFEAQLLAACLVELQGESLGTKVTEFMVESNPIKTVLLVGACVITVGIHAKGLLDMYKQIAPLLEAMQQRQAQEQATAQQAHAQAQNNPGGMV